MSAYKVIDTDMTTLADHIRTKGGTSAPLEWPQGFVDAVDAISAGGDAPWDYVAQRVTYPKVITLSVAKIEGQAFYSNPRVLGVNGPNVTNIQPNAFDGNAGIQSVSFPLITSLGGYVFRNCTALSSVSVPLVTTVGSSTFNSCSSLQEFDFSKITSIGAQAFYSSGLRTAYLPVCSNLGGNSIFERCTQLEAVDLGSGAGNIPNSTFNYCSKLKAVVLRKTSLVTLAGVYAFNASGIASGTGYIYVPDDLVSTYQAATNWSTYAAQIKGLSELPAEYDLAAQATA